MGVYRTKEFARFARKARLTPGALLLAAAEVANGNFDADLGGGVFKQRVARQGGGKSGGFRTILLHRKGRHTFFVYGFAKNEKANVSAAELKALKLLAEKMLAYSGAQIAAATEAGELFEMVHEDGDEDEHD